jgi:hypothetical protein
MYFFFYFVVFLLQAQMAQVSQPFFADYIVRALCIKSFIFWWISYSLFFYALIEIYFQSIEIFKNLTHFPAYCHIDKNFFMECSEVRCFLLKITISQFELSPIEKLDRSEELGFFSMDL